MSKFSKFNVFFIVVPVLIVIIIAAIIVTLIFIISNPETLGNFAKEVVNGFK